MSDAWRPRVRVTRIVDGDSFRGDLDYGWNLWSLDPGRGGAGEFRIVGIDAPELRSPTGPAARDYLAALLVVGETYPVLSYAVDWEDHFGRTLADVVLPDGRLASQAMLDANHASPYPS